MFDYDKLERLIRESGKTKSHLCRAMGKPVYYLRDAIGQKTAIPDELQAILADELGVTVEYLNGLTDQKEKSPASEDVGLDPETIQLREIWESADREERKALLAMAEMLKARRNK